MYDVDKSVVEKLQTRLNDILNLSAVGLTHLRIGGILNDTGATFIAKSLEEFQKIE